MPSRRYIKKRKAMAEINIVPYIDVMLVLLVIFMITAPLLSQGVKVNLPQARAKTLSVKQNTPIIVSVDKAGNYYLNVAEHPNTPLPKVQLLTRISAEINLAKENGDRRPVLVKGDKDVVYGKVIQAMVLLQSAGVDRVGLMTQSAENKYAR